MTTILREYFPMLRTKEEILSEISEKAELRSVYQKWNEEQQQRFLDYCTGQKGVRILYDPFFKEIMNPEINPGRVEELISLILKQKVKILYVLPLESPRIGVYPPFLTTVRYRDQDRSFAGICIHTA